MTLRSRRLAWALGGLTLLAAVAGSGAWWLVSTQSGARWGFERLSAILPGKLDVREMHGPLRGPLEVRRFTYRTERVEITADRVLIQWRLRELWRRRLDIYRLHADNVRVLVGASGDTPAERDSLSGPLPDLNLPVAIIVRDGIVKNLHVTTPGNDSDLVIDRVEVDARSMRRDTLHVNRLLVRSKPLDLDFAGTAFPRGAYPVALRGRWTFRPHDRPAIDGIGTLSGSLDTLRVVQDLSGPLTARIDMRLFRPLRALRYQGQVEFSRFSPRDLEAAWPAGSFAGRVHLEGDFDSFRSEGSVSGTSEKLGPTAADFRVTREKSTWRIDDLLVTKPGSNARIQAHGTIVADTSRALSFDVQTEWAEVGWPLQGKLGSPASAERRASRERRVISACASRRSSRAAMSHRESGPSMDAAAVDASRFTPSSRTSWMGGLPAPGKSLGSRGLAGGSRSTGRGSIRAPRGRSIPEFSLSPAGARESWNPPVHRGES